METLNNILKQFDKNRKNAKQWNEDAVAECFKDCAKQILCEGYFLVNGKYIIDLGAIELYYHEEEGNIKDYIMYHINDNKKNKTKIRENDGGLPYFKFGSFNLHQSGIDVTFENEEKKYRASFLIRSYRVLKTDDGLYPENDNTKYDPHSTHIFDDMFYNGYGNTEIVWVPTDRKRGEMEHLERVNVAVYEKIDDKKEAKISDKEYLEDPAKYIKVKVKGSYKYYERDMKPWRFQLKNIKEEK
jgi:hypothetical protein